MLGNDDLGGIDLNEINDMAVEQTPPCSLNSNENVDHKKEIKRLDKLWHDHNKAKLIGRRTSADHDPQWHIDRMDDLERNIKWHQDQLDRLNMNP